MKKILAMSFFFMCVFLSASADAQDSGFVNQQFNELEQKVRSEHDIKDIAAYLTQVKTFAEWSNEMSSDLKLYIAIKWFDQNYIKEAQELLDKTDRKKTNEDLWIYYRSMVLIFQNEAQKSTPLIAKLEAAYSKDFDVQFLKSIYLAESKDIFGAISVLTDLTKRHSRAGRVYLQRGIYYMLSLSNENAIADFQKAIKYLPKDDIYRKQQAYLQIGLIYWKIKFNQKKGHYYLKKGVELDPQSELVKQVGEAIQ